MTVSGQRSSNVPLNNEQIIETVQQWARELGFQKAAVAKINIDDDSNRLKAWLAAGFHGTMSYMRRHLKTREQPALLVPGTLSVISLRMNYMPQTIGKAMATLNDPSSAYISRYALGRDYHKTVRSRLKKLARRIEELIGPFGYRVFTDSAPVLERALARNAGLGWIGKHTNLIAREEGSFFFLGEIFTDLPLEAREATTSNHCGSCSLCIDACPTGAILAPYRLDARLCISYLTIEYRGSIPEPLRPLIGNRIFGCDDCQLVCPWNRYAKISAVKDFSPRYQLDAADLISLFEMNSSAFEVMSRGSAIRRISHEQWLRNVAIALGNAPKNEKIVGALHRRQQHSSSLVREHVNWAITRHSSKLN